MLRRRTENMKIVVLGKGGCGKSTVTTILARNLAEQGARVLVIDTDESNLGLHRQLGVAEPKELMEQLGGRSEIGKRLMAALRGGTDEPKAELIVGRWTIDDIPAECLTSNGAVSLMHIGKVKHFGEGCACPMGALSRCFLDRLDLKDGEIAIVDTEAGVEHIGRGVEASTDLILMVIDPSFESIRLSEHVTGMLERVGKKVFFVVNKSDEDSIAVINGKLDAAKVAAVLPLDRSIQNAGLVGDMTPIKVNGSDKLTDFIIQGAY